MKFTLNLLLPKRISFRANTFELRGMNSNDLEYKE